MSVRFSRVLSLDLDELTDLQLRFLRLGGNEKLRKFMAGYQLEEMPID